MRPIYENVDVGIHASLKIATYTQDDGCESANWHIHPEYELVYIKNGRGTLQIDTHSIPYSDGVLVFLAGNIPHADFGNKVYGNNMEVVVQFGNEFIEEKLSHFTEFRHIVRLIRRSKNVLLFDPEVKAKLSARFEAFEQLDATEKLLNLLYILQQLAKTKSYSSQFQKREPSAFKTDEIDRLEFIFEHVNAHFAGHLSTSEIAAKVGLTTNSFCRFFKKMTNQSFIQFVNEFRVRKAKELFDGNLSSVSQVMYQCGFNDPSYFTRQFKKYQKFAPTDYLRHKALSA
ncbi:AraC family transcriptional regulator [Flavobacteriaceae bacterium 3-367]|uniref:AraC family transcriptional regulator n=1 Tax=Eudoraea algarum TaxID=3417568 RepID=UPI0032837FC4